MLEFLRKKNSYRKSLLQLVKKKELLPGKEPNSKRKQKFYFVKFNKVFIGNETVDI